MSGKSGVVGVGAGLIIVALLVIFSDELVDGLECLAYYEQCTAKRIPNLSLEECTARSDSVAFLLEDKVCLVRK